MAFTTGTLTGTYKKQDGAPASGTVEIIPNSRYLLDGEGDVILAGRHKVDLDEDGSFSVVLPSTDDATVEPATDRQYTVSAKLHHTRLPAVTGITLPGGSTRDMADLTAAAAVTAGITAFLTEEEYAALVARVEDLEAGGGGGGGGGAVASVNGETGVVVLTAAEVGADPAGSAATAITTAASDATTKANAAQAAAISAAATDATTKANAAQAAAIAASQPLDADLTAFAAKTAPSGAVVGTTDTQTLTNKTLTSPAITTPTGIVKGDVGLGNVDNTSDANKPVSTAQATANTAVANAAASALAAHETDTTNIHGIANTALLETTAGSAAKVLAAPKSYKNTIAFAGDSLTAQSVSLYATGNVDYAARGFVPWALTRLGQRLEHVYPSGGTYIAAVSGENTAEVLARINTNVIALNPGWCHVLAGTNDIANVRGGTVTTAITNLGAYYDALTTAGIRIVAGTIPPKAVASLTDSQRRDAERLNNWIRSQALVRPGFVLADYAQVLSGADGDYRIPFATSTAYTSDGTHESTGGAMRMGQVLADALDKHVPFVQVLPTSNFDDDQTSATTGENLLGSQSMLAGSGGTVQNSGAGVAATGWTLQANGGSIAGVTGSKVTRDDCPGEWQQIVSTSGSEAIRLTRYMTYASLGSITAGDIVHGLCEFEAENLSAFTYAHLLVIFTDSTSGFAARAGSRSIGAHASDASTTPADYFPPRGVFKTYLLTVPANADAVSVTVEFKGVGTLRIARPTLRRTP